MRYKHGAVLSQGSRILGAGYNIHGCAPPPPNKITIGRPRAGVHAEASALAGIRKTDIIGSTILVLRINAIGELKSSLPCIKCLKLLRRRGVRKAIYSTAAGTFERMYL